jgi:hypothetical protein
MGPESFKKPANPLNSRLEEVPELHTDPEVLEHLKSKIAEFSGG